MASPDRRSPAGPKKAPQTPPPRSGRPRRSDRAGPTSTDDDGGGSKRGRPAWSPRNLPSFLALRDEIRSALRSAAAAGSGEGEDEDEAWKRPLRDVLPLSDDYFVAAAWSLFDTPLPLPLDDDDESPGGLVALRRPRPDESCYLLPRAYLREFFEWARSSLVNSGADRFLRSAARPPDSPFALDRGALAALAALSVAADRYPLWKECGEAEWTRWFRSLERGWDSFVRESGARPSADEKKSDDGPAAGGGARGPVLAEAAPPGPVDCRLLSRLGRPLRLRGNVALLARGAGAGAGAGDGAVLGVDEEAREESLARFLDLDVRRERRGGDDEASGDDRPRIGACPVSFSFHEHLRSTLGVICEDGTSVSFSSGKLRSGGSAASALLYHERSADAAAVKTAKGVDIPHPSAHHPSIAVGASNSQLLSLARPIEFPRRILSKVVPNDEAAAPASAPSSPRKMSPYNRLMKEAATGRGEGGLPRRTEEATCAVEVHPVEFRYVVVDPTRPAPPPPSPDDRSDPARGPAPSARGAALVSRATRLSDAFADLKRAAEPRRSGSCVRLWARGPRPSAGGRGSRGATARGDGYDLIDVSSLDSEDLTVEQWSRSEEDGRGDGPPAVELLAEIRSSPTSRWARESLELENRLQVGDFVDAQDTALKWYEAIVREVTPETVRVHYFGWGSRWDGELPRRKGAGNKKVSPPMPLWTKTSRWRERIKVGSEVEVRQTASLVHRPKWYKAYVMAISDNPQEITGGAELELIDEDASGKKIPLKLLGRKRQVLLRVPQERNNCSTPTPAQIRQENGMPVAHPPYVRWVDLYGEEVCEVNTHISWQKQSDGAPATVTYAMDSQRKQPVEVLKSFNNLHGAGFVRESLRGMPPAPGSVGLHNLGNSCYMNSILQCLQHIDRVTQYFLKGDYTKDVNKNNPLGSGGRVATAYASFLSEIWAGEYSILAPRLLKQTVGLFAPQFNNNYQHDSQEFCQYLMDGLHEDLNRVTEKPYVEHIEAFGMKDEEAAVESWKGHLRRHDSIFVDYTQGMHRSHLTCPSCGKESIKYDVYSSISLPLVPSKDRPYIPLKDCLDQFAAGEQLDEHNAWYCSRCKKHVCALKLITLWNTPDILVLHLKRFTFEKCPTHDGRLLRRKIEDKVEFPIDRLDLSDYVLGPKHSDAPPVYKLFGVSEHTGSTANSGHYTATVRNCKDGNWYRYNDSHVGSTSGDAAVTGGAYLLFYQRERGSLRWAGMERQMNGGKDADGFTEVQSKRKKK